MAAQEITYQPNRCYFEMMANYKAHHRAGVCLTFCNEGGSRSGKTFDTFDLIADFCLISPRPLMVYVFRDTLANCKDFTLQDFKEKMRLRGLYDDANMRGEGQRPDYTLNGSTIRFRGLDKMGEKEGFPSDICFFNEVLSGVSREQYNSVTMRCKLLTIMDWNPRFTQHWAFELEGLPYTFFTRTTFRDNVHCPAAVARRIMSYEPTAENIEAGTADEWRWKVYGLGVRAAQEGLIFPNIDWIDHWPEDLEFTAFGMDFGFTNDPTAIVEAGAKGRDLYLRECFYAPMDDPDKLAEVCKKIITNDRFAVCDSADKYAKNPDGMVLSLQMRGIQAMKYKKYQDSITAGISLLRNFRLHIVKSRNFEMEAGAYVWETINGIAINKPIDKFNHLWDASRYVVDTCFKTAVIEA
uniref:hypothetical protein n=1 Tax=Alistipes sp. TaxID=1872444 RepID=UPI0040566203